MNIDYNALRKQIQQIAAEDIKVLSADSLRLYASDVKDCFEKYISAQVNATYTETVDRIQEDKQLGFINLETGYVVSMKKWINNNPMPIPPTGMENYDSAQPAEAEGLNLREVVKRKEVQATALGTVISIGLFVAGHTFIAMLTETLAIGGGIYGHNMRKATAREIDTRKKQELQEHVNAFIATVENNAIEWAKAANKQSGAILAKFD